MEQVFKMCIIRKYSNSYYDTPNISVKHIPDQGSFCWAWQVSLNRNQKKFAKAMIQN